MKSCNRRRDILQVLGTWTTARARFDKLIQVCGACVTLLYTPLICNTRRRYQYCLRPSSTHTDNRLESGKYHTILDKPYLRVLMYAPSSFPPITRAMTLPPSLSPPLLPTAVAPDPDSSPSTTPRPPPDSPHHALRPINIPRAPNILKQNSAITWAGENLFGCGEANQVNFTKCGDENDEVSVSAAVVCFVVVAVGVVR